VSKTKASIHMSLYDRLQHSWNQRDASTHRMLVISVIFGQWPDDPITLSHFTSTEPYDLSCFRPSCCQVKKSYIIVASFGKSYPCHFKKSAIIIRISIFLDYTKSITDDDRHRLNSAKSAEFSLSLTYAVSL
jgi:hypothetical protein